VCLCDISRCGMWFGKRGVGVRNFVLRGVSSGELMVKGRATLVTPVSDAPIIASNYCICDDTG
jgi:hypothetical protein